MTFRTLKGLKKRGVKVDLGFPDQMWDSPDAEVTRLKNRVCQYKTPLIILSKHLVLFPIYVALYSYKMKSKTSFKI